MSASAATITGVELPSSSFTRFRGARSWSFQPTSPEPVNVISFTRSSSTSTSPISDAGPTRTLSQPAGRPASCSSSASSSAESGVWEAGLSTTGQPAASAGAILCATRLHGKLNGEIAPTTPIGLRTVKPSLPSPASLRASTAANVYVDIARDASTRAALIGLPASSEIVRATSSWRRPIRPATLTRISARLCAGSGSASARSAASSACRVSLAPPFATRPTTSPEYGERMSSHSPVSTHSPSISSARSVAVAAMRQVYESGEVIQAHLAAEVKAFGRMFPVYVYAIEHPDGLVLVDTGMIDSRPDLDEAFAPVPHPLPDELVDRVAHVINTHLHFDHCGGNRRFAGTPIHVQ